MGPEAAQVDKDESSDEEDEEDEESDESADESDQDEDEKQPIADASKPNGRVKFADGVNTKEVRMGRPEHLRQHLYLLSESSQQFLRHCGEQEWTVDFDVVIQRMRETELDTIVQQTYGLEGLRLVHILRDRGKMDEKTLANIALMKKSEMQQKMLEMHTSGFVHVQEVPKDNKADVKKSFFLWFCDADRSFVRILDNSYKSMVRCLQVLEVNRQQEKDVLLLTRRTDVRGREKDVMRKEYYDRYSRFLGVERKVLGQVMRLDDLIAVVRDY